MTPNAKVVVMAGGKGERFWPASTPERPKQFIDLTGGGTLIQQTVLRLAQIIPFRDIFVVIGAAHVSLARAQLPQLPARNFIVEPLGRDTAPCIGLAAVWIEQIDPDAIMLVVPADHFIPDQDRFCDLAQTAIEYAARRQALITLGIQPDRPETGYGYIELGEQCSDIDRESVFQVRQFVEKPNRNKAEDYVASGQFLWNSGMFAWPVRVIREEIARHIPELHLGLKELAAAKTGAEMDDLLPVIYPRLPKISIDYGVLERSERVFVVVSDLHWDDLGSWSAVARLRTPDEEGNVVKGLVVTEDCRNLLVESKGRVVATLGVSDLIVVETQEAILVCAQDRAQDIRHLAVKAQALMAAQNRQR